MDALKVVELACLVVAVAALLCLCVMHAAFAGQGECLQEALSAQAGVSSTVVGREDGAEQRMRGDVADPRDDGLFPLVSDTVLRLAAFKAEGLGARSAGGFVGDFAGSGEGDGGPAGPPAFAADYELSCAPSSMRLNHTLREAYGIPHLNVTLPETCLGGGRLWRAFVRRVVGTDTVVINQAMFALRCDGFIRSFASGEVWSWGKEDFAALDLGPLASAQRKLRVLVKSVFIFALVSSITALLIRILMSQGVALMFPAVDALRSLGLSSVAPQNVAMAYPWIGAQMELLSVHQALSTPILNAHLAFAVVVYLMYEAALVIWSVWLYDKSMPSGQVEGVFGYVMFCEYYSLLFARSRLTITFFPRVVLLYFVAFHCYLFLSMYGFTSLGTVALYSATAHLMVYCFRAHEVKSFQRNRVSLEQPRELYSELPHPQWTMLMPPLYSIFFPLNRVQRSIYDSGATASGGVADFIVPAPGLEPRAAAASPVLSTQASPEGALQADGVERAARRSSEVRAADPAPARGGAPRPVELARRVDSKGEGPALDISSTLLSRHADPLRAAEARRRAVATSAVSALAGNGSSSLFAAPLVAGAAARGGPAGPLSAFATVTPGSTPRPAPPLVPGSGWAFVASQATQPSSAGGEANHDHAA